MHFYFKTLCFTVALFVTENVLSMDSNFLENNSSNSKSFSPLKDADQKNSSADTSSEEEKKSLEENTYLQLKNDHQVSCLVYDCTSEIHRKGLSGIEKWIKRSKEVGDSELIRFAKLMLENKIDINHVDYTKKTELVPENQSKKTDSDN